MDLFEQKEIKPMLISDMRDPFNSPDWLYELKLDGIRCVAYLSDEETDLRNKRNMRLLPKFPELKSIHTCVAERCILDGELMVLKNGVPDFYEIQRRTMMSDLFKMQLAYSKFPASFVAYDILYKGTKQLTDLPLLERKQILTETVKEQGSIAVSRYIIENGIELYQLADKQELEGVVAKRKDSKYFFDKRSKDWIKFKRMADEDFVICGYIDKGSNYYSIILGQYQNDSLLYRGSVTLGVTLSFLEYKKCKKANGSPFILTPTDLHDVVWLEPTLVCIVEYMPNTKDSLRQAVYKGIREDILATDCKVQNRS